MANRNPKISNLTNMGKGRPKGSKNQFTNMKEAFINVFQNIGGEETLAKWAKENPTEYYKIVSKMLPKEVDLSIGKDDININHADIIKYRDTSDRVEKELEDFNNSVEVIEEV